MTSIKFGRRRLVKSLASGLLLPSVLPATSRAFVIRSSRPEVPSGVQTGDVTADRALIWSRTDRPARMQVQWDTKESLSDARTLISGIVDESTDYTARLDLSGLPSDQQVFYRVSFEDPDTGAMSEPVQGQFRTAPSDRRNIRFIWSGDTAGHGWGINPDIGGMYIYESMRKFQPDFFVHCGDTIYAGSPIEENVTTPEGLPWRNIVTEAKSKVAETLADFRGNFQYNLLDDNVRRFNVEVPQIWLWDDNDVTSNWSPTKQLQAPYRERDILALASRARRAYLEYAPIRKPIADPIGRIYRRISYGPLLDVIVVDERSYRGGNNYNLQTAQVPQAAFLGPTQLQWLKDQLAQSTATWKVIAADMPIGVVVRDVSDEQGRMQYEAVANADDGGPKGRELEFAELFSFIRSQDIRNIIWLTADVHYAAANHYSPERGTYKDFNPFWEFIAGPLQAYGGGDDAMDMTFGPDVVFKRAQAGSSPLAGFMSFGQVQIDGQTEELTVTLHDNEGAEVYRLVLPKA